MIHASVTFANGLTGTPQSPARAEHQGDHRRRQILAEQERAGDREDRDEVHAG
jgi:hypothetical protein